MKSNNHNDIQTRIGLIAISVVALHLVFALYVIFAPEKARIRNKIGTTYRQLIVLGPFFTESRIKSSHHLAVRYMHVGSWSPYREFGKEHFLLYTRNPWRYDKLPYSDFEKRLSYEVGQLAMGKTFEQVISSISFRELNEYILDAYIQTPVDSINLVYGLNMYLPQSGTYALDTIFNYTYNPNTIGKAKK